MFDYNIVFPMNERTKERPKEQMHEWMTDWREHKLPRKHNITPENPPYHIMNSLYDLLMPLHLCSAIWMVYERGGKKKKKIFIRRSLLNVIIFWTFSKTFFIFIV